MNSRFVFALFLLSLVAIQCAQASPECPEGQVWDECGTACPKKCGEPDPKVCTMQCVVGCRCQEGLILNSKGRCVKPSKC